MVLMMQENVKKFTFIILLFLFVGPIFSSEKDDNVLYIQYAKEIMTPFIQKCENEYKLDCIGTGGRFSKNVGGIDIDFIAYRKGTIKDARILEIKMIETLLARLNTHEKIRPFLAEYPFNRAEINISLAFQKIDNSYYTDGSVVYVSHIKNKLFYRTVDPKTGKLTPLYDEPYEEALKIVNKSK